MSTDIAVLNAATQSGIRTELHQSMPPRFHHLLSHLPCFQLHAHHTAGRADVERYIYQKFAEEWQAEVEQYLPLILSMSCMGGFSAAVGLRCAGDEALYLENYLDSPVEQEIAQRIGQTVRRDNIVEIGNLVATWRGSQSVVVFNAYSFAGCQSLRLGGIYGNATSGKTAEKNEVRTLRAGRG